jgi:hypothetical protein
LMTLMVELVTVVPPGQPHPQPQPDDVGHDTGFSAGHGQPVELVPGTAGRVPLGVCATWPDGVPGTPETSPEGV